MKTSSTVSATTLTTSYQSVSLNVLIAVTVAAGSALTVAGTWYPNTQSGLAFTWWSLPSTCAVVAILIVRALRRGIIVTDTALIARTLLSTRVLPWRRFGSCRVTPVRVGRRTRMINGTCDGQRVAVRAHCGDGLALQRTVDRALSEAAAATTGASAGPKAYPHDTEAGFDTFVLWISLALVLVGFQILEVARLDHEVYAARATRDVAGTGEVLRSRIDEDDSGDGPTKYTTVVDIRFFVGERQVDTSIQRPGRYRFPLEMKIPIVYDSMHPRDADFGDRHNRKADDSSVRLRLWVGPVMLSVATIASIVLGFIVVRNAARSRRLDRVTRVAIPVTEYECVDETHADLDGTARPCRDSQAR